MYLLFSNQGSFPFNDTSYLLIRIVHTRLNTSSDGKRTHVVDGIPDPAHSYTGCHRRNGPNFGRVFLMLNYTDITQNTHIKS